MSEGEGKFRVQLHVAPAGPRPGVNLSWAEAVRVVPEIAANEAERVCAELVVSSDALEVAAKQSLSTENATRDALVDLGEAIERLNREEWELARNYIRRATNILQGKPRTDGE